MKVSPRPKVQTTQNAEQLARYGSGFTLMPGHRPNDELTLKPRKNGRIVTKELGKAPLDRNWPAKRFPPPAVVIKRCVKEKRNVCVRIERGQIVIDVDPRNGGVESFDRLCAEFDFDGDVFPRTITGSGGWHCWAKVPKSHRRLFNDLKGYPGVEFKALGRQVIAAGSVHPNGRPYRWSDKHSPIEAGLPDLPQNVLEAITKPEYERSGTGDNVSGLYTPQQLKSALAVLDASILVKSEQDWFEYTCAVSHAVAGDSDGAIAWADFCTSDPDYADAADDVFALWSRIKPDKADGITVARLNAALAEAGHASLIPTCISAADDFPDDQPIGAAAQFEAMEDGEPNDFENWSLEAEDDPTDPDVVLSRGLKVNGKSEAPDTFKNAMGAILKTGLQPAFNEMARNVEFIGDVPWDESKFGRVLDDAVLAAVRVHLIGKFQGNDYDPSLKNLSEALDTIAYSNRFNPVRDYLDSLEWDRTPRVAKLFGDYFSCGIDAYTRGVSIAFMVGAVARIRKPGCKFDTMPVLKGPQGWNKSTGLRVLFGNDYFSDTNLGSLSNKDAPMKLRGIWGYEFSEIDSLRKHEVNQLKAFISSQVDRQRDPYERRVSNVPRCTVFAGTVNEGGYLSDATGGRRFWPLELRERIDVAALAANRDQLWAEAAALEADGVSLVLPSKLWAAAGERQEAETIDDPWTDTLRDYLARRAAPRDHDGAADDDDSFGDAAPLPPDKVHTSELFDALNIPAKDQSRALTNRLRTVMEARLGWKHKKAVRIGDANRAGYDR